jgi:sucrose phosphorylase
MFMPGIPQVWYLDIFCWKNNYEAADNGGSAGHKEINRTTLTMQDIEQGLKTDVVKEAARDNSSKKYLSSIFR